MKTEIDSYIEELRHTVTIAGLNYEIWWVYKGEDTRPKYVKAMNNYSLFFQVSIHAHFVALLVELYRLYETRKDTYNIPSLLKKLRKHQLFEINTIISLERTYQNEAKPLWLKVNILRNKAFGHRSKAHTVEEVFKEAGVKPIELKELLEVTKKLLNKITQAWNRSAHAFNLGSRKDTLKLLSDLESLRNGQQLSSEYVSKNNAFSNSNAKKETSMTRAKIASVIKKIPELTDFGFGLLDGGKKLNKKEYEEQFKQNQKDLLESEDAFEKACGWLEQIKKIKTINLKRSSYGLKHVAEKDIGYITNGVFIAAAIHLGFDYKTFYDSPNVSFNMSEKSIKQIEKKQNSLRA